MGTEEIGTPTERGHDEDRDQDPDRPVSTGRRSEDLVLHCTSSSGTGREHSRKPYRLLPMVPRRWVAAAALN
jgi:hypothetical protein